MAYEAAYLGQEIVYETLEKNVSCYLSDLWQGNGYCHVGKKSRCKKISKNPPHGALYT